MDLFPEGTLRKALAASKNHPMGGWGSKYVKGVPTGGGAKFALCKKCINEHIGRYGILNGENEPGFTPLVLINILGSDAPGVKGLKA